MDHGALAGRRALIYGSDDRRASITTTMPPAGTSGSRMEGKVPQLLEWWRSGAGFIPSPSAQAKPSRPGPTGQGRFLRLGAPPLPAWPGPLPGGWADGDGMNRPAGVCAVAGVGRTETRRSGTGFVSVPA